MAKEEKPKQLVQMSTVLASGITAIVAALFTSRLGVTGTLIGTALTPMLMTIGVAVLNAQIQKATDRISVLPSTVRGQLSTQRVRVPGAPGPEAPPEDPEPPVTSRRRDRRTPGVVERLLSIPTYLTEMSPSTRRRTLLTGAAAGLVAAIIGLAGVTGLETASGGTLSCTLYEECPDTASGQEVAETGTSLSRALGGSAGTETQDVPADDGEDPPAEGPQQEVAPPVPDANVAPPNGQYEGGSQNAVEDSSSEQTPQELPADPAQQQQEEQPADQESAPQDGSQQLPAEPGVEQQALPSEQQ